MLKLNKEPAKFKIDYQLEFYFDALVLLIELFKLGKADGLGFESVEEYVQKYDLFSQAMKLRSLSRDMKELLLIDILR